MKKVYLGLFVMYALSVSYGAIRMRYSVPRYHTYPITCAAGDSCVQCNGQRLTPASVDTVIAVCGNANANFEIGYRESFYTPLAIKDAWNGFDPVSGWDNAAQETTSPDVIDASVWIDSLFEFNPSAGCFAHNVPRLKNDSTVTGDGYIAYFFGAISIPQDGEWQFLMSGDDGGPRFMLDANSDGTVDTVIDGQSKSRDSIPANLIPLDAPAKPFGSFYISKPVALQKDKLYRFFARQRNHSQANHFGLFWKGPGMATPEHIPASAFGKRRQFGPPTVSLVSIRIGETVLEKNSWSFIELTDCKPATLTVTADNLLEIVPKYQWNWGDGSPVTVTDEPTASHTYTATVSTPFGMFAPTVKALRGDIPSAGQGEVVLFSTTMMCTGGNVRHGNRFSSPYIKMAGNAIIIPGRDAAGITVSVCRLDGRLVRSVPAIVRDGQATVDIGLSGMQSGIYTVYIKKNGKIIERFRAVTAR